MFLNHVQDVCFDKLDMLEICELCLWNLFITFFYVHETEHEKKEESTGTKREKFSARKLHKRREEHCKKEGKITME